MCQTIRFSGGEEIETIGQFEKYFNVAAIDYSLSYYRDGIYCDKQNCLCPINLDKFFEEHPEIDVEKIDSMDYYIT